MPSTVLSHRHQNSTTSSTSSTSSSSSARPALPHILTNSPSNAVHLSRSTARTSRRVRSNWFTHFALTWRRSSRYSKIVFGYSLTLLTVQVIATVSVLIFSWPMYCDKPLRIFLTVYIARLAISSPLNIYLHLAPRRQRRRLEDHAERGENYAMQSLHSQHQSIPSPSISIPTATYSSNTSSNTQSITYPRPIPPMVYPPPTENLYHNSALYNWIDRTKSALDFFATLWFIIGNYMLFTSTTCSETARPIYYLSLAVIVYGYIIISVPLILCTSVIFCLPCVLVGMRLLHIEDGVDMGGASADDINQIPVYRFKSNKPPPPPPPRRAHPQLHHHHHPQHDSSIDSHQKGKHSEEKLSISDKMWIRLGWMESPSEQDDGTVGFYDELEIPNEQDQVCAICLSTYENGDILCRLWCYHHFHKTCVTEWLLLNCKCPLCLRDCRRYKEQQHPDHFSTARSNTNNNNYSNNNNVSNNNTNNNSDNINDNNTNSNTNYDSNNDDINVVNSSNSNSAENINSKNNASNCNDSITKNSNLIENSNIE